MKLRKSNSKCKKVNRNFGLPINQQSSFEASFIRLLNKELENNIQTPAILRMKERAFKKLRSSHTRTLEDNAMLWFCHDNSSYRRLDLRNEAFSWNGKTVMSDDVLSYANDFIYKTLETFTRLNTKNSFKQSTLDFELLSQYCYFGPRASINFDPELPSIEKIFDLSSTLKCRQLLPLVINGNKNLSEDEIKNVLSRVVVVEGGKLSAVPKNSSEARCIMTEPSFNGYCQLGLGSYLKHALSLTGLKISGSGFLAADRNKALAQVGSRFNESNLYGTIDLRKASDSIHKELVEKLMPPEWLSMLETTRSPSFSARLSNGCVLKGPLNLFCTMGNGFTFPLQTLLFTSLAVALRAILFDLPNKYLLKYCHDPLGKLKVSVFGDDIIVPSSMFDLFTELLSKFGFQTNKSKSYNTGGFRESCGGDFFDGEDVTPCYIRDLRTRAGLTASYNTLLAWSVRNNVTIINSLRYLARRLYNAKTFNFVPGYHNPDEGILFPSFRLYRKEYRYFKACPCSVVTNESGFITTYRALSGSYRYYADESDPSSSFGFSHFVKHTVPEKANRDVRYKEIHCSTVVSWHSVGACYLGSTLGNHQQASVIRLNSLVWDWLN